MKKNESVKSIMTLNPVCVQVGELPSRVRKIFEEFPFHHVPVMDGQTLVGVISTVDFMRAGFSAWGADERKIDAILDAQFKVRDLAQLDPVTIRVDASVRDAAELLAQGGFHSLPVVDGNRELIGVITSTDLIKYLLKQY